MTTEKVFELLGEGGIIRITRQRDQAKDRFLYAHNEFDPFDDKLVIDEKCIYDSFAEPFQLINDRYPWYMLYIETVHDDFREFIVERLIEKLNDDSIEPNRLEYNKGQLEECLGIQMKCDFSGGITKWSFQNDKV